MKKKTFQMSALNNKQLWLCDIATRLKLIRYTERDEYDIVGHLVESPLTGKSLCFWWYAETLPVIHRLFIRIWNSKICFGKEAERHMGELIKLGWVGFHTSDILN